MNILWLFLLSVSPSIDELRLKVQTFEHIEAIVEQKKTMALFGDTLTSHGKIWFSRSKKSMRLELQGDTPSTLVVHQNKMYMHYPGLNSTEVSDLSVETHKQQVIDHLFLLLSADPLELETLYRVKTVSKKPLTSRWTPKSDGLKRFISGVETTFNSKGLLVRVVVTEKNADTTIWNFSNIETAPNFDHSTFAPPEGS